MRVVDFVLESYGRIIRVPVVGALVAGPVRLLKRLFSDPSRRFGTKLDLTISAGAAMRNDLDGAMRRIEDLEHEVQRLQLMVKQQVAALEAVNAHAATDSKSERVVVRVDWPDGTSRETSMPGDGVVRLARDGTRADPGAGGAHNGSAGTQGRTRVRPAE